ncbi:MAG: ABC transporter ATP-binding protein/permease [Clostridiales bacterium]|nr:ABC transporter ATP-binding protein/permease [Clostridiales bacterium]
MKALIKKLAKFAKRDAKFAILCPLMILGEVLLEARLPFLVSKIIDIGIAEKDTQYVIRQGLMMLLMALASLLFGALAARFAAVAGISFGCEIRAAVFKKVQSFSFANIDKFSTPSIITRLSTDIQFLQLAYMMVIRICVRSPMMLITATSYAVSINARLSLIFLAAVPVLAGALVFFASKAYPRFEAMFKKYDKFNASVQENLIAIRVVKTFVRARHEKEKFRASNDDLKNASIFAEKMVILSMPTMSITMYSCILAVMWFGGRFVAHGTMTVGELTSFISYISQILMSLMMVSMVFVGAVIARSTARRVIEILDEVPDIADGTAVDEKTGEPVKVKDGSIEFKNVSFKYNKDSQNSVLDNINISIKSGETIGIIGGTGSAKTTLVHLIPRLYDVTGGELTVGGRNVKDYTIRNLRDAVSMVLQKNVLFSGTIEDNLRWGNPNATEEEIINACKIAQAHDFVMSFPDGYKTDLGQGGVNVSGGQKQRLCIARALLKKPKIIILDDSTSAVDTHTDAKIREGFKNELGDITTIIIAQRISSIEHADRIIIIDDGKINDIGTHTELIGRNEIYSEIYNSQLEGSVE